MRPPVQLQNLLMVLLKLTRLLRLPKNPTARLQKVLMEQPLVVTPLPALPIQRLQGPPARLHALKPRGRALTNPAALAELLHGRQHGLGSRGDVRGRVGVV